MVISTLQEVIILVYYSFMWFKQQTSSKSPGKLSGSNMGTDPYLGPLKRPSTRQEPVFGPQTISTITTVDLEPVENTPTNIGAAPKTQFQHKVANQSHHNPAHIVASKPHVPKTVNAAVNVGAENFTIPADVTIEGTVQTNKAITIAGTLIGNITQAPQLLLLPNGKIAGDVQCQTAEISGTINGNMLVAGLLVCRASAQINGAINYGSLRVEEGAVLNGTLQHNLV